MIQDTTGQPSFAADPNEPAPDQALWAGVDQLRCGGAAVTHTSSAGNSSVENLRAVRFAVRAPLTGNEWSFRVLVLAMPRRADGSRYNQW